VNPGATVRPAAPADQARLAAWFQAAFEHLKTSSADPWFEGAVKPPEASSAHVAQALADGSLLLVAELDGTPAGFLHGRLERPYVAESPIPKIGHVSLVWVEPALRGRGVAQAMIAAAEAWFRERGIGWVQLSYQPANREAAGTWPALGFEVFRVHARKRL